MAADYARLIAQLRSFYDFTAKAVLLVGAGGGQLLDPTVKPKKLIAIEHDRDVLAELERRLAAKKGCKISWMLFARSSKRSPCLAMWCMH